MIQRTAASIEARSPEIAPTRWQSILADSITSPEALLEAAGLDPSVWLNGARPGHRLFPVRVPAPYLSRIRQGDPDDPLLRQVLPLADEAMVVPGYVSDPLAEETSSPAPGLIRKYQSRALLMITGQCAINCRYCFRRHFPYDEHRLSPEARDAALAALAAAPEINEIIFSGGDPLAVNDRLLARWSASLDRIPHLKRLRIHSRLPVVIPQRVDEALLGWLGASRLKPILVIHVNHPREIDSQVIRALARLQQAGVTLLNQSVILRGINDHPDTLCELSERLFDAGVMPYYLHAFDPVSGAHHFDVPDSHAKALLRSMQNRLPGYLVPRLAREVPGRSSKTLLDTGMELAADERPWI